MYLKSVEVYGFKSFANRIKIELNPGITAIVGPNGCGKSNVVDSIKWSIGEMSRRALRMPSMMDVIFAGTTKRQPLNMAEVTLTFDNQERKLNYDFNEVAVTRKVYRSEESEYFINKTPCRLKDIRDMFLDTGIGSDGYAIISQGEIEALLSSDSIGRREYFEEVAGVSKYKAKREEALKKLEKVDMDLSVLENSLQIIDEQIKKLDAEAKKAKLQQKYKEELKNAELALIVKEVENFRKELEIKKNELNPLITELNELSASISAIEAQVASMNISLTEKNEEEKNLLTRISQIKSNKTIVEHNIISSKEKIEDKLKQIKDIELQEKRNEDFENKAKPEIEEFFIKLENAKKSSDTIKKEYEDSLNLYSETEKQLEQHRSFDSKNESDTLLIYQEEKKTSNNLFASQSTYSHLKESLISINKDFEDIKRKEINIDERQNQNTNKLNEITEKKKDFSKRLEEKISEKNKNLERKKELEETIFSLKGQIASLKSKLENALLSAENDTYWIGTNLILNSQIPGVYSTLRHIISFDKNLLPIIEDTFGKFLDSIIVNNEETAQKAVEYLKNLSKGRARFLILDKIPVFQEELSSDYKNILNLISYPEEYKSLISHLIKGISFNEDLVKGDFWLTGGVKEINTNESYWGEIDELKVSLSLNEKEYENIIKEKDNCVLSIENLEKEIYENQNYLSSLNVELASIENEIKRISEEKDLIIKNKELFEKEILKVENEKKEIEEKIKNYTLELENLKNKSEEIKRISSEGKNKILEFSNSLLKLKEDYVIKTEKYNNYQEELRNLENNYNLSKQRLENLNIEKENLKNKKIYIFQEIENLKTSILNYETKQEEEMNNLKEAEIKMSNISSEIFEIKNSMERFTHNLKENRNVYEEMDKKKQELDLNINTINIRIEDILNKLQSDWQVLYEEIKPNYINVEVDNERVAFLRRRVENMGPVNMTAPQEYDALISRYQSMRSQIEDLHKAKSDLKNAIQRINETTKDNFKITFDKVQHYFKNIYSVLFNGGEANLILTEPDNLLETGVEIMAHPPGKKLINISQLSGGEKSLTAIALLFSFFKVNPSPFCIMDEVDAALDEGNVERFARMIKEFSSETQFLIITHNKRTMEIADIMYGVTMEELGVSKLVSVDLKRAIDMTSQKESVGVN